MTDKYKILILIDWFDPAFKAGGPIRSAVNVVEHLHQHFELYVLTSDRDLGDTTPLPGIEAGAWTDYQGKAKLYYAPPQELHAARLQQLIKSVDPDFIYLNSMFSVSFSLIPLWLKRRGKIRGELVLAPRGMLKKSALAFKPLRKKLFLRLFRWSGLVRILRFQATDEQEFRDIKKAFPGAKIWLTPNLPGPLSNAVQPLQKIPGSLSILFVGRLHPIKNLDYLICCIQGIEGNIKLTIIGSREDAAYWAVCEAQIARLGPTIKVNYLGEQAHTVIIAELNKHHIFALPTRGENFGHAIFEALSQGRPVLISDQTPWQQLSEVKAGWVHPLADKAAFTASIRQALLWNDTEYGLWAAAALARAKEFVERSASEAGYNKLFSK